MSEQPNNPSADTAHPDPRHDADLRNALCDWLRANDIDPGLVPAGERPECSYRDGEGTPFGGHTITTRVRIRCSPDGNGVAIRLMSNRLEEAMITKYMKVPPPTIVQAWLAGRCPTCGR